MPRITIIRGLPGSGKSTLAAKLAAETNAIVMEPDSLLYEDGVYVYTHERHKKATRAMYSAMFAFVRANLTPDIIIADVFPTRREITRYRKWLLNPEKYTELVITIPVTRAQSFRRNLHRVPMSDIDYFAARWEEYPGEEMYLPELKYEPVTIREPEE